LSARQWRGLHIVNWEALNGPTPKGHRLKCIDRNTLNTDASNWMAVPNGLLVRLNNPHRPGRDYDTAPAELRPTIMAVAKLEHRIREMK
jgi:hypothetical protein